MPYKKVIEALACNFLEPFRYYIYTLNMLSWRFAQTHQIFHMSISFLCLDARRLFDCCAGNQEPWEAQILRIKSPSDVFDMRKKRC